jgi:hypothetical protein
MKATRLLLAAMVLGTVVGASQANAQCSGNAGTCNTTNTASVTVGALVKLTMSPASTTLSSPTADQIDLGTTLYNAGPTFTVKSNRAWNLKIKTTASPNWNYSGTDAGVKPISDLTWANAAAGTYAAITTSDATVTSSLTSSNGAPAEVHFKTLWSNDFTAASNAPGIYSLPVVFTLTAP